MSQASPQDYLQQALLAGDARRAAGQFTQLQGGLTTQGGSGGESAYPLAGDAPSASGLPHHALDHLTIHTRASQRVDEYSGAQPSVQFPGLSDWVSGFAKYVPEPHLFPVIPLGVEPHWVDRRDCWKTSTIHQLLLAYSALASSDLSAEARNSLRSLVAWILSRCPELRGMLPTIVAGMGREITDEVDMSIRAPWPCWDAVARLKAIIIREHPGISGGQPTGAGGLTAEQLLERAIGDTKLVSEETAREFQDQLKRIKIFRCFGLEEAARRRWWSPELDRSISMLTWVANGRNPIFSRSTREYLDTRELEVSVGLLAGIYKDVIRATDWPPK